MNERVTIAYCGVCCNHCGMHLRIPKRAKDLKRFIDAYRYGEWIQNITRDFDFQQLMKGLDWFANSGCVNCLKGGGMSHCEVRTCCLTKKLKNCYFCPDFSKCEKLNYQKETYDVGKHLQRIKRAGYENWLKEQRKKINESFDNIQYLEKRK